MKTCMKMISALLVFAVVLSLSNGVSAVGIVSEEEMGLSGLSNVSVTQATNRYFAERNAYLLGETAVMDWPVIGIVNDEIAHKAQYADENIVLTNLSYTISSVACYDTHADVSVTETVSYVKNGAAGAEEIVHILTLYLDADDIPVVAADEYAETFSAFYSCSYIPPAALANSTTPAGSSLCIVEVAKGELGTEETGDNITKYGEWFGMNGEPWCAMFVSWCADHANIDETVIKQSASCTDMRSLFEEQNRYYLSIANGGNYTPVVGDIIYFGSGTRTKHVGIVALVENGAVWFYDGNHIAEVTYRSKALTASDIVSYGHPNYEATGHTYSEYECSDESHWRECTVCGYTAEAFHTPGTAYTYDLTHHWKLCTECGIQVNKAAHVPVNIGYNQYKCKFCNFIIISEVGQSIIKEVVKL